MSLSIEFILIVLFLILLVISLAFILRDYGRRVGVLGGKAGQAGPGSIMEWEALQRTLISIMGKNLQYERMIAELTADREKYFDLYERTKKKLEDCNKFVLEHAGIDDSTVGSNS